MVKDKLNILNQHFNILLSLSKKKTTNLKVHYSYLKVEL